MDLPVPETRRVLTRKHDDPLLHWCGKQNLCGDWCISKKAVAEVKTENQKPVFDLTLDADKVSIEQVCKIQEKFTTLERIININHMYSTQLNESLNMQIFEVAPK